jgi:hypothetical protein
VVEALPDCAGVCANIATAASIEVRIKRFILSLSPCGVLFPSHPRIHHAPDPCASRSLAQATPCHPVRLTAASKS